MSWELPFYNYPEKNVLWKYFSLSLTKTDHLIMLSENVTVEILNTSLSYWDFPTLKCILVLIFRGMNIKRLSQSRNRLVRKTLVTCQNPFACFQVQHLGWAKCSLLTEDIVKWTKCVTHHRNNSRLRQNIILYVVWKD